MLPPARTRASPRERFYPVYGASEVVDSLRRAAAPSHTVSLTSLCR
ncbi:hypothetical protein RAJCM14343_2419 [Rhodococcus aetherivorans]|uniref:Uncharacterized protein n=1 Tax=Rhodococcus aetherivorans TaxID=191292 RepID=A0ABQ0YKS0_9NOCA|nr:hypothetical protein RAJCM14343_2419 [Rhodococcus aetherivorans]